MRLTRLRAIAARQALNHNASDDLALVGCSDTLGSMVAIPRPCGRQHGNWRSDERS
jgi:hypothetical protein